LCLENDAIDVLVADNFTTQERVWKVRRNIPEALTAYSSAKSSEDIVVPLSNIPKILPELKVIADKYNVLIPCFGHAGDGNIHSTIVKKPEMEIEEWKVTLENVRSEVYKRVVEFGGTISGEHGIGHKRKKYLDMVLEPVTVELMKRVKLAFDPNNILNPGKIFDL
ncbi:MAG: FAD-binding oxidoreductase, partial [Candidatus Marinimicrobia bacterium]|nr:FAD-binding oxidoreductase [Candidatus Neomarinimicrobiota bacterium]